MWNPENRRLFILHVKYGHFTLRNQKSFSTIIRLRRSQLLLDRFPQSIKLGLFLPTLMKKIPTVAECLFCELVGDFVSKLSYSELIWVKIS